jgi:hypothetical protein
MGNSQIRTTALSERQPITTPQDLKEWELHMMQKKQWGRMKCVHALDISYDRYMRLRKGRWIPAHIGLAMTALTRGMRPYKRKPQ